MCCSPPKSFHLIVHCNSQCLKVYAGHIFCTLCIIESCFIVTRRGRRPPIGDGPADDPPSKGENDQS